MSEVIRIFVEKKDGFNVLAKQTLWDIRHNLGMKSVEDLRYIVRYDLEGLTKEEYDKAKTIVLSEPNADVIYEETLPVEDGWKVFAMEYLPGQYDQRGDSAEQCVQLLTQGERCKVLTARVIALKGNITDEELVKVEEYLINPVESRLASLEKPKTLDMEIPVPENVNVVIERAKRLQQDIFERDGNYSVFAVDLPRGERDGIRYSEIQSIVIRRLQNFV